MLLHVLLRLILTIVSLGTGQAELFSPIIGITEAPSIKRFVEDHHTKKVRFTGLTKLKVLTLLYYRSFKAEARSNFSHFCCDIPGSLKHVITSSSVLPLFLTLRGFVLLHIFAIL